MNRNKSVKNLFGKNIEKQSDELLIKDGQKTTFLENDLVILRKVSHMDIDFCKLKI